MVNYKEDFHKIKFKCQKCLSCCQSSSIRLSPYDILKLCKFHGVSTSDFHQKHSYFVLDAENQNLLTCMLKTEPECSYLSSEGCQVYSERPFGCRVFPLMVSHFFDSEGRAESKNYVVENCSGFNCKKKISVGDFKKEQGVSELLDLQEEWVRLKVKIINSNISDLGEFNQKFRDICYDFDSDYFQKLLKEKGLVWPDNLKERFGLIVKMVEEELL